MQGKNARVHCTWELRASLYSMIHRPCLTLRRLAPARDESKKWAAAHFQIHFFHHHHHFHHFTTLQSSLRCNNPILKSSQKEVKPLFSSPLSHTYTFYSMWKVSEKLIHKTALFTHCCGWIFWALKNHANFKLALQISLEFCENETFLKDS